MIDAMPHRQYHLPRAVLQRCQSVEFALRPVFREKIRAQDHDAVLRMGQAVINFLPQAVSQPEFILIEPHSETRCFQELRQRPGDRLFIFAGVADEDVPLMGAHGGRVRSRAVNPIGTTLLARIRHLGNLRRPGQRPLGTHAGGLLPSEEGTTPGAFRRNVTQPEYGPGLGS
jgi:hypothetical protein